MQRYYGEFRDKEGRGYPGAVVTVYLAGTSTKATIFHPDGPTITTQQLPNPFTTDSLGNYAFAAANGDYDIHVQASGVPTRVFANVSLMYPSNLNVLGNLNVPGDETVGGDATVYGSSSVSGDLAIGGDAGITGNATMGSINNLGALDVAGDSTLEGDLVLKTAPDTKGFYIKDPSGNKRWVVFTDGAESGSDAGSDLTIGSYKDDGSFNDFPMKIIRAAGGIAYILRDVSLNNHALSGVTNLNGESILLPSTLLGDNGGNYVGQKNSFAGSVWRSLSSRTAERLSVKDFGAIGDGSSHPLSGVTLLGNVNVTGWTLAQWQTIYPHATALTNELDWCAIQAAVNYAWSLSPVLGHVWLPGGKYMIDQPITSVANGDYVHISGEGIRSTWIVATGAITMLKLSRNLVSDGGVQAALSTRRRLYGISFFGAGLATCLVDASESCYTAIHDCEFSQGAPDSYQILFGEYVNRFENNLCYGLAVDGTTVSSNILRCEGSLNNLVIERNAFTSCKRAIHAGIVSAGVSTQVNSLIIERNTFDTCTVAAIVLPSGGNGVTIARNYFEACGKDATGHTVYKTVATTEQWFGTIIGYQNYSSTATTYFKDLVIEGNTFANCYTGALATISGWQGGAWRNNSLLAGYTYTHLIDLKWLGTTSAPQRIEIQQNATSALVTGNTVAGSVVGLDTDDNTQYALGLIIRANLGGNRPLLGTKNLADGWWNWATGGGTETIARYRMAEDPDVFVLNRDANAYQTKTWTFTQPNLVSDFRGKYLRLNLATMSLAGTAGMQIKFYISGVLQFDVSITAAVNTWANWRQPLIYIPTDATSVMIIMLPTAATTDVLVKDFTLVDAGNEPTMGYPLIADFYAAAAPTTGTWNRNDVVWNSAPSAAGAPGWVCTTAPGTFKAMANLAA